MRSLVVLLLASALSLLASAASAQTCPDPRCQLVQCDYSCCFAVAMSFCPTDAECSALGCATNLGCIPGCGTQPDAGRDAARDAAPDAPSDGGADAASDAGAEGGTPDGGVAPTGELCVVLIHGSSPTSFGPSMRNQAEATYWGNYSPGRWIAHPERNDRAAYLAHAGRFALAMQTGSDASTRDLPGGDLPNGTPGPSGYHWASIAWEGTWTYYWAALDVLQQLEAIENGRIPVSLAYAPNEEDQRPPSMGGPRAYHAEGVNHCQRGDRIITVGHSMGNLVMAFILGNSHPSDLNNEFLRTGGLNPANAPYFSLNYDRARYPFGRHVENRWDEGSDFGAGRWNYLSYNESHTDHQPPSANPAGLTIEGRWALPAARDFRTGAVVHPATAAPTAGQRCFFPPPQFADTLGALRESNFHVRPEQSSGATGDPQRFYRTLDPSSLAPDEALLFPYFDGSTAAYGDNRGRCIDTAEVLSHVAYHYSLSGPLLGTPAADCGCTSPDFFAPGNTASARSLCTTIHAALDALGDYWLDMRLEDVGLPAGAAERTNCNMASYSLQTSSAVSVANLASRPSRRMFLVAGTNPFVVAGVRILDAVYVGGLSLEPHPWLPPLNDQIVPVPSAMACNVDLYSPAASMSLRSFGDPGGSAFTSGLCGASQKVWPAAPGDPGVAVNDFAGVFRHVDETHDELRRAMYALPDGFWAEVRNPLDPARNYDPGEVLNFGYVDNVNLFNLCFRFPGLGQWDPSLALLVTDQTLSFDLLGLGPSLTLVHADGRRRYYGLEHMCVRTGPSNWLDPFSVPSFVHHHRTIGHVLGIEERYARRRRYHGDLDGTVP